jgi:hypothetical protein
MDRSWCDPSTPAVRAPRLPLTRVHATTRNAGSQTRLYRSSNRRSGSRTAHRCSFVCIASTRCSAKPRAGPRNPRIHRRSPSSQHIRGCGRFGVAGCRAIARRAEQPPNHRDCTEARRAAVRARAPRCRSRSQAGRSLTSPPLSMHSGHCARRCVGLAIGDAQGRTSARTTASPAGLVHGSTHASRRRAPRRAVRPRLC